MKDHDARPLPDARRDIRQATQVRETPQTLSPTYRLSFIDDEFMTRDELRPVRLQLELLKTQMMLEEMNITSTVVMFGGARIPSPDERDSAQNPALSELSHFYDEARKFARLVTEKGQRPGERRDVIVTGGGPGVMEAGNRGAHDAGGVSIGLGIVLPHEQAPNGYVTPELSFNFHYFAIRKMHFLMRARAVVVFPGGFGTLDELFETLTLIQTQRMEQVPVLLFGEAFWRRIINWEALAESGTISDYDLKLFSFVETAEEALKLIDAAEPPAD